MIPYELFKVDDNKKVEELFEESLKSGIYSVKLYDTGEEKEVIIDDYFPVRIQYDGTAVPCFSKAHDNELWVMILEKVWAKIHGSYANIISGNAQECLHDLTGAPTKYL